MSGSRKKRNSEVYIKIYENINWVCLSSSSPGGRCWDIAFYVCLSVCLPACISLIPLLRFLGCVLQDGINLRWSRWLLTVSIIECFHFFGNLSRIYASYRLFLRSYVENKRVDLSIQHGRPITCKKYCGDSFDDGELEYWNIFYRI